MINADAILSWFTGKDLARAQVALAQLTASIEQGGWLPGASRAVAAALTKPTVIVKLARKHEKELQAINHYMVNGQYSYELAELNKTHPGRTGWELAHNMRFGSFAGVQTVDFIAIISVAPLHLLPIISQAHAWAQDMAPVAAAVARLDRTRPRPTFTRLGLSPTVTATLVEMGVDGRVDTLRLCPTRDVEVEEVVNGRKMLVTVSYLNPPAGTVRHIARYQACRCEACGHAIKNAFNWVPLLADDAAGVPHLFLVGRDCARNLFGIEMKGDLQLVTKG